MAAEDASTPSLESTADLLRLTRKGEERAREILFGRFNPVLRRWAHGRLPRNARGVADTDDLVQDTLIRALNRVEEFEPRHEGAFLAYLRRILLNRLRDQIRGVRRRPAFESLDMDFPDARPSPVEEVIRKETLECYEQALSRLPEEYQEAILLRVEFGYQYQQIAEALERETSNSARLLVARALTRLAKEMHVERDR